MPIVVKHGGSFGNAGQIAAQAIQADLQQKADRAKQMDALKVQGAIASHQAQMRYHAEHEANQTAIRVAAMESGLEQDMKREEYLQSLAQAREEGRQKAQDVEYKYTTQQRIEDAKYARAEKVIRNSDRFTPEEKKIALERIGIMRAGIREPTEVLGDPNKPKYEPGKEPGKVWAAAADGGWSQGYYSTDPKTGLPKLMVRPDQTPEYLQQEAEFKRREKELEYQQKRDELIAEYRIDLFKEDITSYDSKGNETTRKRTPEEVDKIIESALGVKPQQKQEQHWAERLRSNGFNVQPGDLELGEEVGGSVAFLRTFGDAENAPPQMRAAAIQAAEVVARAAGVDWAEEVKPAKKRGRVQSKPAQKSWADRLHQSMSRTHTYGY
jgi:3-dehydroquinate dehydratase